MTEVMVTLAHARAAKLDGVGVLCANGIRDWCRRHEIDLHEAATTGIPASRLRALGCPFADRAVAIAAQEAAHVEV